MLTTDLMPLEPNAGPPAEKATIAQLVTLLDTLYAPITGGAYVLKAGDTMTGRLIITQATANTSVLTSTGYSLTGANAQNMLDFAGTWNTSGNPTALKIAITNTASGATSKFLEFFAGAGGATSVFAVDKSGFINIGGISSAFPRLSSFTNFAAEAGLALLRGDGTASAQSFHSGIISLGGAVNDASVVNMLLNAVGGRLVIGASMSFCWSSNTSASAGTLNTTADVNLFRDAASVMALRTTTTAQTFRLYRTFTDLSNYERMALQTAAGQMIIAAETAGTGTDDLDLVLTPAGVGRVTLPGGAQLLKTTAAMTSGAAAGLGTLSNAPTAGNPAVWCPIMFNGVQHWFPCWT